jgi:hypothetical protein
MQGLSRVRAQADSGYNHSPLTDQGRENQQGEAGDRQRNQQGPCPNGPRQAFFSIMTVIPTLNSCPQWVQV